MAAKLIVEGVPVAGMEGVDVAKADELFDALQAQWKYGDEITKYLRRNLELETLADFANAFKKESAWDKVEALQRADDST